LASTSEPSFSPGLLHDDEVRRGTRQPKTMREFEIWREARAEQDERLARRIARADRGQQDGTEGEKPPA